MKRVRIQGFSGPYSVQMQENTYQKNCPTYRNFAGIIQPTTNPLSTNPTKWLNTLKQLVDSTKNYLSVCLTILWSWCLKG